MDSDMQHPPELLPTLLWHWAQGSQVVYTRRRRQQGRGFAKELGSRLFYRLINRVSDIPFEEGSADFRLLDRVVVDALRGFGECWPFYRGLVQWMGFRRTALDYDAPDRFAGESSYSWSRMLRLGIDAMFSFSLLPLRLSYYVGGLSLLVTFGYAVWLVFAWLVRGVDAPGYTSLVLLITFLGGLHLLCLGIVGEYVGRIHVQVKQRPLYLVKETLGLESSTRDRTPLPRKG
jgi:dolichol-phosphate mannosyltransferase